MTPRPSHLGEWLFGSAGVAACAAWVAVVASCRPPPRPPNAPPPPQPHDTLRFADLLGTWEWRFDDDQPGLHRTERERWHLAVDPAAPPGSLRAVGAYDRDVTFTSTDGVPFICDDDTVYHQRARYHVRATVEHGELVVVETGYEVEPSPCDHPFRKVGDYRARATGDTLSLRWDGGEETLRKAGDAPLPDAPPWPGATPRWDGAWTWAARTVDDAGNLRDEREDWQVAVGADGLASATYVRTVTTTSIDGRPLACSGTRRWSYVDRYGLEGHLDGAVLTLTEIAADAGTHPCLAPVARRSLDALTAQVIGDYVVVEWRGKRRQVLRRPRAEPEASDAAPAAARPAPSPTPAPAPRATR